MRRLLITGASGYLGAYLASAAAAGDRWEITGTFFSRPARESRATLRQLDLRDRETVRRLFAALQPDAVIHTACSNRDSHNISAILPAAEHLAAACRENGARLVHISTDLVFDGEQPPYSDDAPPAPIGPYGQVKAEAEAAVISLCPSAVIARPSLIWALDPLDRQTGWLVEGLRHGAPVTLFTDEVRCPVYLADLANAVLELAALPEISAPVNLGGRQPLNRWDFGLRLLSALRLARGPNVQPGTVAGSGLVRARNLTLDSRRAQQLLVTRLRGVDEVLANELSRTLQSRQPAG